MTSGITDVINAKRVTLTLNPGGSEEVFITLQELVMPLSRRETREEVALGSVYFYGQHDNAFEATMLLTANDLALYLNFNAFTTGTLPPAPWEIQVVGKDNVTKKITVTAVTPHQVITKEPRGGVKIRQYFRIVEDVDGGDVT